MRFLALLAVLTACDKLPAAPEAKAFEAMSLAEKCEATLPRAKTCTDELMVASLQALNGGAPDELAEAIRDDLDKTPTYSDDAEAMHRTSCLGSRGDSYPRGILRCWEVTPCRAFAECVYQLPAPASPRR